MSGKDQNQDGKNKTSAGFGDEQEFLENLKYLKVPAKQTKDEAWTMLFEKIENKKETKQVHKTFFISGNFLRIAASVLLLISLSGAYWFWENSQIQIFAKRGQQLTIWLPDSSCVKMNAETKLSYNSTQWYFNRKVYLEGEALFTVKHGRNFEVISTNATTTVLGTIFNVYARNNKTRVSCVQGKVRVKASDKTEPVILTAGQSFSGKKEISKPVHQVAIEVQTAWSKGEFYFNNAPLSEVIAEIERQFDVHLVCIDTAHRFYSGYFSNNNLDTALNLVCIPMQMEWKKENNKIEITANSK